MTPIIGTSCSLNSDALRLSRSIVFPIPPSTMITTPALSNLATRALERSATLPTPGCPVPSYMTISLVTDSTFSALSIFSSNGYFSGLSK